MGKQSYCNYATSIVNSTENIVNIKRRIKEWMNRHPDAHFIGAYASSGARLYFKFEIPQGTPYEILKELASDSIFVEADDLRLMRNRPNTSIALSKNITEFICNNDECIPIHDKNNKDGFYIEKKKNNLLNSELPST